MRVMVLGFFCFVMATYWKIMYHLSVRKLGVQEFKPYRMYVQKGGARM